MDCAKLCQIALIPFCLLGCRYGAAPAPTSRSVAFERSAETSIGRASALSMAQHPGKTGVYVLENGLDAFAARVGLVEQAECALDVQYYIFHHDLTGHVLLSRLVAAADRGVRVRLLLDDLGSAGVDDLMAAADLHPGIEVRLFNPFARGTLSDGLARGLDVLVRPGRLNHRMHNKLLLADGAAAIVGGRNVGDEYFAAAESVNFADLDLLAFGPVNRELGESFDRYWNSSFAAPLEGWSSFEREPSALDDLRVELASWEQRLVGSTYEARLKRSNIVREVTQGDLRLTWGLAHAASDLPRKIVASGDDISATLLIERVKAYWPPAEESLIIISPYFVPRTAGVEYLCGLVERGVRVRVLTNSLAATDVAAVHSGYMTHRRALLEGGVELHELRPTAGASESAAARDGSFGSSGASLHAKSFLVDGRRVFVGSLNLDPRSVNLNTELGLVIESRELAAKLTRSAIEAMGPEISWSVTLEDGDLVWRGSRDGKIVSLREEPDSSWWDRFSVGLLSWMPIEGQL